MRENILALLIIAGLISGLYFLAPVIYQHIGFADPDEIVTVHIELENRCSFDDKVFVVNAVNTSVVSVFMMVKPLYGFLVKPSSAGGQS